MVMLRGFNNEANFLELCKNLMGQEFNLESNKEFFRKMSGFVDFKDEPNVRIISKR